MMYLLQVMIYTALMYGIYILVLKNNAAHNWSRAYLLASAVLPLLLPFVYIPIFAATVPDNTVIAEVSAPVIVITNKINQAPVLSRSTLLLLVYIGIGSVLLLRLLWQFVQIRKFVKQYTATEQIGVKVIYSPTVQPGSWGRYIFLPANEKNDTIINHELAHIQLRHSYDIILLRLLKCIFWPNLVLYVIEKELKIVHEFQADAKAVVNKEQYAQTLLNTLFDTNHFSLSHTFFHKPLKRRITMLGKKASASLRTRIAVIAGLLTLSLVGSIIFLQGCKRETADMPAKNNMSVAQKQSPDNGEKVLEYTDVMPEAGYSISDYIGKNLVYPQLARDRQIEGRVVIKFIVDKDGYIKNPIVLSSPDNILSEAALNVVNGMPKWKPGKKFDQPVSVYMELPILFRLGNVSHADEQTGQKTMKNLMPALSNQVKQLQQNKTSAQTSTGATKYNATMQQVSNTGQKVGTPFKVTSDKPVDGAYQTADKMPSPTFDYADFIMKNLHYPKEAQDKKIEGRVVMKFVVDVDGSIKDVEVLRSPDMSLSLAATEVVNKMPKWNPGEIADKKVPVYYVLPIQFKLN